MPNYTDNRVILSHKDTQQIDNIYNIMNTDDAELCQAIIPMDLSLLDSEAWYDWRIENWGTKWDIYDATCDRMDANTLVLDFFTAWSPPIGVFHKLVDMGFDIDARYFDEGWLYVGQFTAEDGAVEDYCTDDMSKLQEERPELDDEFGISWALQEDEEEEAKESA